MMASVRPTVDSSVFAPQLDAAIQQGEFELYYQPLIDISNASIHGVEALIRWNHPERGPLQPADFIHVAEESGSIVPMGSWVLRQACTDFRRMRLAKGDLLLSVNVSTRQLDEPTFISDLSDILQETGMPARLLQLEITESIFLMDSVVVGALFEAIRALGVKIAFDDFGTGYSSLSYLERFHVDVLKVDQYFVQHMSDGHVSTEIVEWIVRLARIVGTGVSAEGVESREQAAALLGLGCNIAQGFLYSKPVPLNEILAMLQHVPVEASGQRKAVHARPDVGWTPGSALYAMS